MDPKTTTEISEGGGEDVKGREFNPFTSSPTLLETPTATIAGLVTFVLAVGLIFNQTIPWPLAACAVIIPAGIISALKPRWATDRGLFFKRPALFTACLAYVLVFAGDLFGLFVNETIIFVVIGGVVTLVGFAFPRDGAPAWFESLFGEINWPGK